MKNPAITDWVVYMDPYTTREMPAVVACVNESHFSVDLVVFDVTQNPPSVVRKEVPYSDKNHLGTWHWPTSAAELVPAATGKKERTH